MDQFFNGSAMSISLWILCSVIFAVTLLLLSVFEGKREELIENVVFGDGSFTAAITDALVEPQERLRKLDDRFSQKNNKLEISQDKLEKTKRTISQLELTSGEVQQKYRELLGQLKDELSKTETECHSLHVQIENIALKRDKLKEELTGHQVQIPSEIGIRQMNDSDYPAYSAAAATPGSHPQSDCNRRMPPVRAARPHFP